MRWLTSTWNNLSVSKKIGLVCLVIVILVLVVALGMLVVNSFLPKEASQALQLRLQSELESAGLQGFYSMSVEGAQRGEVSGPFEPAERWCVKITFTPGLKKGNYTPDYDGLRRSMTYWVIERRGLNWEAMFLWSEPIKSLRNYGCSIR